MIVKILGSAAGGGFPQWNCNTRLSRLAWEKDASILPRTQSSIAISSNGSSWAIVNASPDIRQQIAAVRELQPRPDGPLRNSPLKAAILTNSDVDHVGGLLSLRERQPFHLYATSRVLSVMQQNSIFNVLAADVVPRIPLPLDTPIEIADCAGITVEAFAVSGKVALYLEDPAKEKLGTEAGDTIGLKITSPGSGSVFYVPGCASVDEGLLARVHGAGCLLFDGTLFTDDEVIDLGVLNKTSRRMGHVPITGDGGSLSAFENAQIAMKAYIHINTTNPILERGSEAEKTVNEAGWTVAYDGMTIEL